MVFLARLFLYTLILLLPIKMVYAEETQTSLPLKFDVGNPAPYGGPSTVITIQGKSIPILFDTGAKESDH